MPHTSPQHLPKRLFLARERLRFEQAYPHSSPDLTMSTTVRPPLRLYRALPQGVVEVEAYDLVTTPGCQFWECLDFASKTQVRLDAWECQLWLSHDLAETDRLQTLLARLYPDEMSLKQSDESLELERNDPDRSRLSSRWLYQIRVMTLERLVALCSELGLVEERARYSDLLQVSLDTLDGL